MQDRLCSTFQIDIIEGSKIVHAKRGIRPSRGQPLQDWTNLTGVVIILREFRNGIAAINSYCIRIWERAWSGGCLCTTCGSWCESSYERNVVRTENIALIETRFALALMSRRMPRWANHCCIRPPRVGTNKNRNRKPEPGEIAMEIVPWTAGSSKPPSHCLLMR